MAMTGEPLSDERLAEIRDNWTRVPRNVLDTLGNELRILQHDRNDLLAEVERLRAREAALQSAVDRIGAKLVQERDKTFASETLQPAPERE